MKEYLHPFWWFGGMMICIAIFELLNTSFKQELNRLFNNWDISHHEVIASKHSTDLYWDLVDFIKELMKRAMDIFAVFSAAVMLTAMLFKPEAGGPILSFCLGIITYRFGIFKNWLGMKKYGEDKRPERDDSSQGK